MWPVEYGCGVLCISVHTVLCNAQVAAKHVAAFAWFKHKHLHCTFVEKIKKPYAPFATLVYSALRCPGPDCLKQHFTVK